MLPTTIPYRELVGKYVTLDHEISNGAGIIAPAGTKCLVSGSNERGLDLTSDYCPKCKRQLRIQGVRRGEITLWEEEQPTEIEIRKPSGRKVVLKAAHNTKSGIGAESGTRCRIIGTTSYGYTLRTEPCPCCGTQLFLKGVPCRSVEEEDF